MNYHPSLIIGGGVIKIFNRLTMGKDLLSSNGPGLQKHSARYGYFWIFMTPFLISQEMIGCTFYCMLILFNEIVPEGVFNFHFGTGVRPKDPKNSGL